ncbi:diaminopimelate epimerase [Actinotalea sp.]|uniref:diaminopimelate epimerase n=1 Tax=Actinotalea sp. TaxID=1872145 RepID=UPI002BAC5606|nr:diaminopimelate epimerase [Actinotalea sp.]HQY33478.1 diaminopimelate epimerase [Actinotalea sp.]HRA50939.1 diaminopimelate epimerase [Actinotalea sp.]
MSTLAVTKGHGTGNDFVLVDDRAGVLDLPAGLVGALCDRHIGIGGDGLIRLVGSALLPEGAACLAQDPAARWFMDYRNGDGSIAEMCGNGVRVLARFAERLGLWDDASAELVLGTRAGVRRVRRVLGPAGEDWYSVDMGPWHLTGGEAAERAGADALVAVDGLVDVRPGLRVDVGNPHTVIALADPAELDSAELWRAPRVEPAPPAGTNVELVVPLGEELTPDGEVGRLRMRVHERGVGETRSCGTGACAAAMAVRTWAGPGAPATWLVEVPGGTLRVRVIDGGRVELAGPAVLVASVEVDLDALGGGVLRPA